MESHQMQLSWQRIKLIAARHLLDDHFVFIFYACDLFQKSIDAVMQIIDAAIGFNKLILHVLKTVLQQNRLSFKFRFELFSNYHRHFVPHDVANLLQIIFGKHIVLIILLQKISFVNQQFCYTFPTNAQKNSIGTTTC